jgi:hypothetical protein
MKAPHQYQEDNIHSFLFFTSHSSSSFLLKMTATRRRTVGSFFAFHDPYIPDPYKATTTTHRRNTKTTHSHQIRAGNPHTRRKTASPAIPPPDSKNPRRRAEHGHKEDEIGAGEKENENRGKGRKHEQEKRPN